MAIAKQRAPDVIPAEPPAPPPVIPPAPPPAARRHSPVQDFALGCSGRSAPATWNRIGRQALDGALMPSSRRQWPFDAGSGPDPLRVSLAGVAVPGPGTGLGTAASPDRRRQLLSSVVAGGLACDMLGWLAKRCFRRAG